MRTVVAGVLVLTVAACTESSVSPAAGPSASETSGATSDRPTSPAEDGSVLVRHPQRRGTSGWLIWLRREQ